MSIQLFLLLLLNFTIIKTLKIYKSTLPLTAKPQTIGLHYIKHNNQNFNPTHSITFCIRFNYNRLGENSQIFYIPAAIQANRDTTNQYG